jgi:hypothetical protein
MLDNTDPKTDVIHIMLTKDALLNLAEQINNNTTTNKDQGQFSLSQQQLASQQQPFNGLMKFAIQPSEVKTGTNSSMYAGSMGSM